MYCIYMHIEFLNIQKKFQIYKCMLCEIHVPSILIQSLNSYKYPISEKLKSINKC